MEIQSAKGPVYNAQSRTLLLSINSMTRSCPNRAAEKTERRSAPVFRDDFPNRFDLVAVTFQRRAVGDAVVEARNVLVDAAVKGKAAPYFSRTLTISIPAAGSIGCMQLTPASRKESITAF